MRSILIFTIAFIPTVFFISCSTQESTLKKAEKAYANAVKYGDYQVAIHSVHDILAEDGNLKHWKDTLMVLYLATGSPEQALKISDERIKDKGHDQVLTQKIRAAAYKQIGNKKEAVKAYEELFPLTEDPFHLYDLATLQYELGRLKESDESCDLLLQLESIKAKTVKLAFNKQSQSVPLEAAIYNIKGTIAKDQGENAQALSLFDKALEISPGFLLAEGNKSLLQ